jgi:serine/threonine protein kinase
MKCPKCEHDNRAGARFCESCGHPLTEPVPATTPEPIRPLPGPASFVGGCYQVKKSLGEGGMKRVYLAYDTKLDRDVAFAVIKTEGLDAEDRTLIEREARAMGQFGDHPSILTIYEYGEHEGQPGYPSAASLNPRNWPMLLYS